MEYVQANLGRIFIARLDNGDDIINELKKIIKKEDIKAGFINIIGASANSKVVLGPEKREFPPVPCWWQFDDAREVIGTGVFAWENEEPKVHIHAGFGHHSEVKIGCVREKAEVYLTIEVVIQELTGTSITRKLDKKSNISLLNFENK